MEESQMKIINENTSIHLKKKLRKEGIVLSEWLLTILLNYLNMRDIVAMDSAICNKSDRKFWLECIARNMGSVSTKIQPYITNDRSIAWCSKKHVNFKCLHLDFRSKPCLITTNGATLLSKCCTNITDYQWQDAFATNTNDSIGKTLLIKIGLQCTKLKKLMVHSSSVNDLEISPLLLNNLDLEDIQVLHCLQLTDACLELIASHCHGKLRKICIEYTDEFTDDGIAVLVSNNHDLEEIRFIECGFPNDGGLIAIANNCNKLKTFEINCSEIITDEGFMAIVSSNHGLENISLCDCPLMTDASLIAIANNCHTLHSFHIFFMHHFTDQGITTMVSNNHDLESFHFNRCDSLIDNSLKAIAQNCHKLKIVNLHYQKLITDEGLMALVSSNRGLKDISFISCQLLSNASLIAIADNCHTLRKFDISYMHRFTDKGIVALVSSNRDLEEIELRNSKKHITDTSLLAIAANCHKLRKINFADMKHVHNQGILAVITNNHNLEEIHVTAFGESFTIEIITAIAKICHNLKKVDIRFKNLTLKKEYLL